MVGVANAQLFLLLSVLSMTLVAAYELYKGPNWGYFFGGLLSYMAVLPLVITNAFDFSASIEQTLFRAGIVSAFLGVAIVLRTKYSSRDHDLFSPDR
ncbi:hypothetical protein [Halorubrum sp. FL23]|uniref:hypothetical protein n=1 Tax=Halorubrum sp. FL23 TaxID=3458704 RepID=UPI0040340A1D